MDLLVIVVYAVLFLTSALSTLLLVPVVMRIAHRYGIVDRPDGVLKVHAQPTPYLGGVAVFLGFLLPSLFVFYTVLIVIFQVGSASYLPAGPYAFLFSTYYGGIFFLLLLGLADDLCRLQASTKWLWQIVTVAIFFAPPVFLFATPLAVLFYVVWTLSVINLFNLVDVMDGLATTIALCAAMSLMVLMRPDFWGIIGPCFAGALLGFLFFNRPPAKIYLGDAGSLLLGGIFAQAPLFFLADRFFTPTHNYFEEGLKLGIEDMFKLLVVPGFILLIPALEVFTLIVIRWYKGIPFYQGSHDHFAHYLLRKGWSKKAILLYVSLLSFALFLVAWLFQAGLIGFPLLLFCATVFVAFWYFVLFLV